MLLMCLWTATSRADEARIVVPETTAPFRPIVARIAVPNDPYSQVVTAWSADPDTSFRPVRVDAADELDVWATPGAHWLECIVVINRYEDQTVLVPDEQEPANVAKYKSKTLRVLLGTDVKKYRQPFTVGPLPKTPDTPGTPQTPNTPTTPLDPITPKTPTDGDLAGVYGLAPKVRDKVAELVPIANRAKVAGLAKVYLDAANEVIDNKLTVLNAARRLQELNGTVLLTDDDKDAWKPFLDWLGGEMLKLAAQGKLLDKKGVIVALSEISLGLSLAK